MGSAVWVLVVLAAVLVLVALVVFVAPLVRSGAATTTRTGAGPAAARPGGSTGPMARGFGYLCLSPVPQARRSGVRERLVRVFARIDAVDPHAAPRRIGEALAQVGLGEPTPSTAPSELPPDLGWRSRAGQQPRDVE